MDYASNIANRKKQIERLKSSMTAYGRNHVTNSRHESGKIWNLIFEQLERIIADPNVYARKSALPLFELRLTRTAWILVTFRNGYQILNDFTRKDPSEQVLNELEVTLSKHGLSVQDKKKLEKYKFAEKGNFLAEYVIDFAEI